jgi:hypothetical protein
LGPDTIQSPSGIRLKKFENEKYVMSPTTNEPMLVKEVQWKPVAQDNPHVTSIPQKGSRKIIHQIAPPPTKTNHEPNSQQNIHHHYYHYPEGTVKVAGSPGGHHEPTVIIPNPSNNLKVAPGLRKVITNNDHEDYDPEQA